MNAQYKKGVFELCVLSQLKKQDCYGYVVSEILSKYMDISDGTVYPILRKLKSEGLVTTYVCEESGGPPRKYYKITELGLQKYDAGKSEWLSFVDTVKELLEEDGDHE